jgi:GTP diphosphokinase / guanosine-3',5'-bis(diphosphate) 3'-diphosphatase
VEALAEPPKQVDQLEELIARVKSYNPYADETLIRRAYDYAAHMHRDQKRMSGEPYVIHPLNVSLIIAQLKLDVPSIVTGLLHDVVEDTSTSLAEVQNLFGAEVATLVDGVTKVSKITFQSREEKQAENFRKMIIAMAQDIRVVLIKLADRLHNMRTLHHLAPDRQIEISRETLEIYAPLAHRMGIYWLKSELEDASLRYLDPPGYQMLKAFVAKTRVEREAYIKAVIEILSQRLVESGVKAGVTGRPKHFYSIYTKMRNEGLAFEEIYDVVAFRIIVDSVRECYEALGVVHANWKPVPGRFKDYIALPKVNMYQSLHTTVIGPRGQRMEVQIRTHDMHRVAEEGIAAHWSYKEGNGDISHQQTERFAWLRRLIEWQQNVKDPQEFLSTVKDDLFPEEVFVFTPKGDVLDFPRGSTIIDFAYRIHSQVGNRLIGARVNGRMVPLRYKLESGDTVEVITSEKQVPGKDWLNWAVTARAKSRIRQWLRAQESQRSIQLAMAMLDHELEPLGLSVNQLRRDGRLEQAVKEFSTRDVDTLLAQVGYGLVSPGQLLTKVLQPEELKIYRGEKALQLPTERPLKDTRKAATGASGGVVVSGLGDVLVRFAHCCNPLPGERITGFITRGRGVTIHLVGCPRALETDPQRRVPVVWKDGEESPHPIRLEVLCVDKPGVLAAITKNIAAAGINISSAEVKTTDVNRRSSSLFELNVTSARQLNTLMHSIATIDGVLKVTRIGQHNGHRPA